MVKSHYICLLMQHPLSIASSLHATILPALCMRLHTGALPARIVERLWIMAIGIFQKVVTPSSKDCLSKLRLSRKLWNFYFPRRVGHGLLRARIIWQQGMVTPHCLKKILPNKCSAIYQMDCLHLQGNSETGY